MKIAIASDHGGFELKEKVREYLVKKNIEVLDLGCEAEETVFYPEYGKACAEVVIRNVADMGIVFCGSGVGMSIAANKIKGIRCALCTDLYMAETSRKYNNANMLALGGKVLEPEQAFSIVDKWLSTDFEGGRFQHSVDLLNNL